MKLTLSTPEIDRAFHLIKKNLESGYTKWQDFRDVGIDEWYYDYYYAEDRLYVIRDRLTQQIWLTIAGSPREAWENYNGMCKDLNEAMTGDDEYVP